MTEKLNSTPNYNTHIPPEIMTPDSVETSIGTLNFFDGVPTKETADLVYDQLDTMRAADTFLKGMPGASLKGLIDGAHSIGAVEANEVMIFDNLMDAKSLFLTGNSSTVYCIPDLDLKRDGPTVVGRPGCSACRFWRRRRAACPHQRRQCRSRNPSPPLGRPWPA